MQTPKTRYHLNIIKCFLADEPYYAPKAFSMNFLIKFEGFGFMTRVGWKGAPIINESFEFNIRTVSTPMWVLFFSDSEFGKCLKRPD